MRTFMAFWGIVLGCIAVSFGVGAATEQLRGDASLNFTRACRYTADSIAVSVNPNAAVASTGLQPATRYRVFCAQATYFDQEASGGAGTATTADSQIAANASIDVWAKQADFISFRAVAATGQCDILECQ